MPRLRHKKNDNERRKKLRFALQREMRFKVLEEHRIIAAGAGETMDIGSGGVAFRMEHRLHEGSFVELSISWPVLLNETCPMRLVVFGRIVRTQPGFCACTIDKYEFRTQARTIHALPGGRGDSMLERWASAMLREEYKLRAEA